MCFRLYIRRTLEAKEPQDEDAEPSWLLRSLSSLGLRFVIPGDVIVPAHVAPSVLWPPHGRRHPRQR